MATEAAGSRPRRQNVASMWRKTRQSQPRRSSHSRVVLEKVLGITTNSSGLTCDHTSGLTAYPAGCVIVLLHPKKNKQRHIINTSRKTVTALAFSLDGKYLVSGESGHLPCVRVWAVADGAQLAEVQCHQYGVSCVSFSANSSCIVSVGHQHDQTVNVWEWQKGTVIASNKVSSRVLSVSFSEDSSYFVTAGNRHVKFWYLDASRERRVNSTVPLIGRSGLLGDFKTSLFCGVACGRGKMADVTYCLSGSGTLCLFSKGRHLESWIDLKTPSARCLSVTELYVFCGCADGTVRVLNPRNLQYISTLQRPHCLGVELAPSIYHGTAPPARPDTAYPDTLALTFDPASRQLTCVYSDHSVYVWDVRDVRKVEKVYSALYHSGCVWGVETYPEVGPGPTTSCFITCSSDNTIRLWNSDGPLSQALPCTRNLYSNDLLRIVYVGEDKQHLQAEAEPGDIAGADGKSGIRVLRISPDGQHLAAGDHHGNVRIFGLNFLDELVKIEAHDSEVLCLEFSPSETGLKLLASASRDRLIHVFDLQSSYSLEQSLYDHSGSVTAIKFTGVSPEVNMLSCGADKSIYFRSAEQTSEGLLFSRRHHVVEKTTLYDMDVDATRTHAAIACQDRNVRVYEVESGKMKRCLKGSSSDDGTLLKVTMDPTGSYLATSCSDKSISILDYESGEAVVTLIGHSEIVTGMRFSQDCRHLITVSGDSCVFIWGLDSQMTNTMRKKQRANQPCKQHIRRETFIAVPSASLPPTEEEEDLPQTPARLDATDDLPFEPPPLQSNGKLPLWFRKLDAGNYARPTGAPDESPVAPRSRWTEPAPPLIIHYQASPSPNRSQDEDEEEEETLHFFPQSLDSLLGEEEEEEDKLPEDQPSGCLMPPPTSTEPLPPAGEREFKKPAQPAGQRSPGLGGQGSCREDLSPDSACCDGSARSSDLPQDDTDCLSQGSSFDSWGLEEEEDGRCLLQHFETLTSGEQFDTDLRRLPSPVERDFLNPRFSISTRFLSRFRDRVRSEVSRVEFPRPISEEQIVSIDKEEVNATPCPQNPTSGSSPREEPHDDVTARTLSARSSILNLAPTTPLHRPLHHSYMGTTASYHAKARPAHKPQPGLNSSLLEEQPWAEQENLENRPLASENLENRPLATENLENRPPEVENAEDRPPAVENAEDRPPAVENAEDRPPAVENFLISSPSSSKLCRLETVSSSSASTSLPLGGASNRARSATPPTPTGREALPAVGLPDRKSVRLEPGSLEQVEQVELCGQAVEELRLSLRKALELYEKVKSASWPCDQASSVLKGALHAAQADLQSALREEGEGGGGGAPFRTPVDDRTVQLLERYSDSLLQMMQHKLQMNDKTFQQ